MAVNDQYRLFNSFGDASTIFSFFPSESHKKAVHRIIVGLESKCGLVMLTGKIGTGKTTLFRHIQRRESDKFIYAEVGNPFLSPMEQISHFCKKFGLESPQNLRQGIAALSVFFEEKYREGKLVVLIYDESHLLTKSHWGQILVFSNLRKDDEPIVQVLLVGQTELVDRLMEPGLEALNQRIGIRCELSPLSREDTRKYILFKLESSDGNEIEFSERAMTEVWRISGGVPRLINHACSHLLDQVLFSGGNRITPDMVKKLASDNMYANLFESGPGKNNFLNISAKPVLISLGCLACCFLLFLYRGNIISYFSNFAVSEDVTDVSPSESGAGAHVISGHLVRKSGVSAQEERKLQPEERKTEESEVSGSSVDGGSSESVQTVLRTDEEKSVSETGAAGVDTDIVSLAEGEGLTAGEVESPVFPDEPVQEEDGIAAVNSTAEAAAEPEFGPGNTTVQVAGIDQGAENGTAIVFAMSSATENATSAAVNSSITALDTPAGEVNASIYKGNGTGELYVSAMPEIVNGTESSADNDSGVKGANETDSVAAGTDAAGIHPVDESPAVLSAGNGSGTVANKTILVLTDSSKENSISAVENTTVPGSLNAGSKASDDLSIPDNSTELVISLGEKTIKTEFSKPSKPSKLSKPAKKESVSKTAPLKNKNKSKPAGIKKKSGKVGKEKVPVAAEKILDGQLVPEIASIEIEAVAYSDSPADRLAVLNQALMRQGDMIGRIKLLVIDKDELIFALGNNKYRRVFGDRTDSK